MIKDGNYQFANYEDYVDKFVEVFTKFYGEQYRDKIKYRLDRVRYVPYYSLDYVSSYYVMLMSKYKDDLVKAFEQVSGVKATPEIADILWDAEDHASPLYTGLIDGEYLEKNYSFFKDDGRKAMLECREKAYKAFGLENDKDKFVKLAYYGKCYTKARKMVEEMHPCDVFTDVRKVTTNEDLMLKNFLNKVSHLYMNLSEHDRAIIHNEDFDMIDAEMLDCKYLLFHIDIHNAGYLQAFGSEAIKTIEDKKADIDTRIDLLKKRVKFYVFKADTLDILKFVTPEEVFGMGEVKDKADFIMRLANESDRLSAVYGEEELDPRLVDTIEVLRQEYSSLTEYGCLYNKNITRQYASGVHEPDKYSYITHMYNPNNKVDAVFNDVFMKEDDIYSPKGLNANFIHELGHVLSNLEGLLNEKEDRAIRRIGLSTAVASVNGNNQVENILYRDRSMDLEENINERLKKELVKIYEEMYPGDYMYKESDIVLPEREEMMPVYYDLWNLLTEDFYNYFKENIKKHRIDPDYNMYFEHAEYPATALEAIKAFVKDNYKKYKNPIDFSQSGVVDYRKVRELGVVVEAFRNNIATVLCESEFPLEKVEDFESEEFKALPKYLQNSIIDAYGKASLLFVDMRQDLSLLGRTPQDDIDRYDRYVNALKTGSEKQSEESATNVTVSQEPRTSNSAKTIIDNITQKVKKSTGKKQKSKKQKSKKQDNITKIKDVLKKAKEQVKKVTSKQQSQDDEMDK